MALQIDLAVQAMEWDKNLRDYQKKTFGNHLKLMGGELSTNKSCPRNLLKSCDRDM